MMEIEKEEEVDIELADRHPQSRNLQKQPIQHSSSITDLLPDKIVGIYHLIGLELSAITDLYKSNYFLSEQFVNYDTLSILENEKVKSLTAQRPHLLIIGLANDDTSFKYRELLPRLISSEFLNSIKRDSSNTNGVQSRLAILIMTTNVLHSAYWLMKPIWKLTTNIALNRRIPEFKICVYSSREKNHSSILQMMKWLLE